jgi:hypothetical protein
MSDFGISKLTGDLLESVDVELKAETKELITSAGAHSAARSVDQAYSFSVKGKGTSSVTIGGSTGAPTGVSGKVIITSITNSQTNDDWQGFSYSGTGYVHAT